MKNLNEQDLIERIAKIAATTHDHPFIVLTRLVDKTDMPLLTAMRLSEKLTHYFGLSELVSKDGARLLKAQMEGDSGCGCLKCQMLVFITARIAGKPFQEAFSVSCAYQKTAMDRMREKGINVDAISGWRKTGYQPKDTEESFPC